MLSNKKVFSHKWNCMPWTKIHSHIPYLQTSIHYFQFDDFIVFNVSLYFHFISPWEGE